jgi:putative DNA primase/helicase
MSPSAIFRTIDAEKCPILIDEADSFLRGSEELRGLLNSGHTRASSYVIRSVEAGNRRWEPKRFSTWCAMVITGIGQLPDTIEDRSIAIVMRRKLGSEKVERLTRRNTNARAQAAALASMLVRFASDNLDRLKSAEPAVPNGLSDRAADNWDLLLAIAELAGEQWATKARAAAEALSGERESADTDSFHTPLLSDIRSILGAHKENEIASTQLCKQLIEIETSPWAECNHGRPITPAWLSRRLKNFGVLTRKVYGGQARGYRIPDFKDPFTRYLPAIPPDESVQASEPLVGEGESNISEVSKPDTSEDEETSTERSTSDTLTLSEVVIETSNTNAPSKPVERERFEL